MTRSQARKILGVEANATPEEIKAAYRRLSMKYHPDRAGGSEEQFKNISEAYKLLQTKESAFNFEDLFNNSRFRDHTSDEWWKPNSRKTTHVQFNCPLSDAFNGCTKKVTVNGTVHEFKVPAGAVDNEVVGTITDVNTYQEIDVHVRITTPDNTTVDWTPTNSCNITITIPVSPFTMMKGGQVEVEMIDGGKVKVHIPAGLKANALLKVKGKGYWNSNSKFEYRGDCLLRVIPDIKPIKEYAPEEILSFMRSVYGEWLNDLPVDAAHEFQRILIDEFADAMGFKQEEKET